MELEQLLQSKVSYRAPQSQRQGTNVPDFWAEYQRSLQDPEGFWAEQARQFYWLGLTQLVGGYGWDGPDNAG